MRDSGRWRIEVRGTVQGVGFRPFVYRAAREAGLCGFVHNTGDGVTIEIQGEGRARDHLLHRLRYDPPPLARIQDISVREMAPAEEKDFSIISSRAAEGTSTHISPDIAPCDDCLRELVDHEDRRHGYPFINCINCGPRYTIIEGLPYDRPMTTMKAFALCPACAREYADPLERRFHAQPNACPECGPQLQFVRRSDGPTVRRSDSPLVQGTGAIEETRAALARGEIVAIKGVGGFHLACDAANDEAVLELRRRKRRDEKPFAVMVRDLEAAHLLCHLSDAEASLLSSPARSIVLARKKGDTCISAHIAPGNRNLGLMLPSSPLHHLLFHNDTRHETRDTRPPLCHRSNTSHVFSGSDLTISRSHDLTNNDLTALVMTSGNISDEPIAFTNDDVRERLADIADAFLLHDRDIRTRADDSIARIISGAPVLVRRARGFVPEPLRLAFELPPILALGADLKGAICLAKGRHTFLSQHLGDLENALAHRALEDAVEHLQRLLDIQPDIISCDLHPDYFSTRFARTIALSNHRTIAPVQHHHAHIASCMAEHDLPNETVIGIALDGTGFGPDGTVWGGEVLLADYAGYKRAARIAPAPLPGGDAAAREPWRMALAHTQTRDARRETRDHVAQTLEKTVGEEKVRVVRDMIDRGIHCPLTSSCGRLFDAVAAVAGLRMTNTFEGQAAMMLEQIADEGETGVYEYDIAEISRETGETGGTRETGTLLEMRFEGMFDDIVADISAGTSTAIIAAGFHNTLVDALTKTCTEIRSRVSCLVSRVCFSGGCFQNALLTEGLKKQLEAEGFTVYRHSLVPPNDGGIALGQAVVAAHAVL